MNCKVAKVGIIGTNFYVITDEETGISAAIDPGANYSELEHLLEGKNVKYIFITHGHYDHILGAAQARRSTGAEIVIGEKDAECLSNPYLSKGNFHFPEEQECIEPDIIAKEGDVFHVGNTEIKVMETPGHTPGGVCYIIEKENVIFSGDTLFFRTCGRTDFPNSSQSDMENSLKKLASIEGNYTVYPGHGFRTTLDDERAKNPFMR